jgi:hypothetical protein
MVWCEKRAWLGAAAAVLALSSVASAGYKLSQPVTVGASFANGAIGSARNSANPSELVSVTVRDNSWAWFYFVDANGKRASCTTIDPELIALGRSVNGTSYVHIEFDKAAECTSVTLHHASYLDPPVP